MSKWESMGDHENLGGNSEWAESSHRTFGLSKVGNLPTFQGFHGFQGLELGEASQAIFAMLYQAWPATDPPRLDGICRFTGERVS